MTDKHEKFISNIKEVISLTPDERGLMRRSLQGFTASYVYRANAWQKAWSLASSHVAVSMAVVIVLLASGTSVLAQNTVPGDTLYPIKEQFNNKIRSAVAINDDDKIDVELDQIDDALNGEEKSMDHLVADVSKEDLAHKNDEPEIAPEPNLQDEERELNKLYKDIQNEEKSQTKLQDM